MEEAALGIGWAIIFIVVGGLIGGCLVLLTAIFIPRLLVRMGTTMNEEKEISGGNRAAAEYFGRIVGATIVGISIVIAAAIFAGVIALLY